MCRKVTFCFFCVFNFIHNYSSLSFCLSEVANPLMQGHAILYSWKYCRYHLIGRPNSNYRGKRNICQLFKAETRWFFFIPQYKNLEKYIFFKSFFKLKTYGTVLRIKWRKLHVNTIIRSKSRTLLRCTGYGRILHGFGPIFFHYIRAGPTWNSFFPDHSSRHFFKMKIIIILYIFV